MLRILSVLISIAITTAAQAALGPDPKRDWHSADTAHFRINYADQQRAQAERVAGIAERAYARLTRELKWEPSGKIEIVLLDEFDIANGFSTPLPFNKTAIFLTPPNEGELLDNSTWLDLLITHELTHTIHLDKVRGAPNVIRHIFGRNPLLFPNLWQPVWAVEGLATWNESTPEAGQGRLRGPMFEAWMRIEHQQGFKSLAEMNADGRALPTSKQYLYGVYFYDFLARKYGTEAIYKYVDKFSGNVVPRVHSNPVAVTGKPMDELWEEFIADLTEQMSRREAQLQASPRADGDIILPANFQIDSLAPVADGVLAVVNDGLLRTMLLHVDAQGKVRQLTHVKSGSHIDVRADGKVLIAQPDICRNYNYYYDLYTWNEAEGLRRKTSCGRYRQAAWSGNDIVALRTVAGVSTLAVLQQREHDWREVRTLYQTPDQVEAVDLAASPDGKRIALAIKQAGAWQVLEFDSSGGAPRVLFSRDAPLHGLRYTRNGDGLEFVAVQSNSYDLWRYTAGSGALSQMSRTYTAVLSHSGVAQDGSVVLAVLAPGGTELRRMPSTTPLAQAKLAATPSAPLSGNTPPVTGQLGEADSYLALYSLYPRTWLPAAFADRGLTAYGASTFGGDALGWHNYSASALWETSQHEAIGSISYSYLDAHLFNVSRNLWARQWTGTNNNETTMVYDRTTDAQWVSMLPWLRSERRLYAGIGAAMQTTERVQIAGLTTRPQDERVAAAFLRYDTRDSNWYADGFNRGNLSTLLYESYRPFNSYYDGHIVRFDTRRYLPFGRSVLSGRWTEAHAQDITEPFQLGGSFEYEWSQAPMLNQRNLPLRGYLGGEAALRGQNVRNASIEWRTPIADVDRHAMVPPVGLNRLSAAVFLDAGRAWDNGAARQKYYRGAGVELLSEVKLYYRLTLPLRIGIARGMDAPGGTRVYLQLGMMY
ncbi:MAG TPA: hypothetical protein VK149_13285 [Sideroxyarcus sp.]|nr:hypothetical protein [Sideroxyarcus sp.]